MKLSKASRLFPQLFTLSLAALVGCGGSEPAVTESTEPEPVTATMEQTAEASLLNPEGETIGTVMFSESSGGTEVHVMASSLAPGEHGFHVHAGATCVTPDFTSAEGHFNPTGAEHGSHAGDLMNLAVGSDGTVDETRMLSMLTVDPGEMSVVGHAVVIHGDPDDYESQPSGNAGPRIACGEIHAN